MAIFTSGLNSGVQFYCWDLGTTARKLTLEMRILVGFNNLWTLSLITDRDSDKVFKQLHFNDSLAPMNTLRTNLWN
jgi:hypothetical protein